jgi:uncharacterized protein with GYD domain
MATYISLINWTDQGIKNVKESPKRLDASRELGKKFNCNIRDFYMTIGAYDIVAIVEAPDDESAAKFTLALGALGNLRTTTLKAFSEDTFRRVIGGL